MRKLLRVLGIIGVGIVVVILLCRLGLGVYLDTGHARRLASEQLSSLLGGNVRVTNLDAGMGSTDVRVEVLAPAQDQSATPEPIITGIVQANISPIELAAGSSPSEVTLTNAQITLRFDKDGNLLTRLPEPQQTGGGAPIPTIKVKQATIHLMQEGRPDFRANGIDVTVADDGQKLTITGGVNDPNWKTWTLSGEWARSGESGTVALRTRENVMITPEALKAVPFIPAETWDWVVINGTTPCGIQVTRGADKKLGYRVELDPRNARLTVPPIDLTTTDTSGHVVVENGLVTLSDVKGDVAGGNLHLNSKLNFTDKPSVLTFDVKANDLNIPQLPKTWGLPALDAGKLVGDADLKLVVEDGKVHPWGRGEAEIVGGKLLGGKVAGKIRLVGDGERLRFRSETAMGTPRPSVAIETVVSDRAGFPTRPVLPGTRLQSVPPALASCVDW